MNRVLQWLHERVGSEAHLSLDSRALQPGDVFLACPGQQSDGRSYIGAAVRAGAGAIVYEAEGLGEAQQAALAALAVPSLGVSGLRQQLGALADAWYGHPSRDLEVIAVTGTNGKTTSTHWIAQALNSQGVSCGIIGTLGVRLPDGMIETTGLTTPDVVTMHRALRTLLDAGAEAVAIEASSIGLEQGRLDGVTISVAAFTNLSQDHLDVHGTMQAYERAKQILFELPGLQSAVINFDDPAGRRFAEVTQALEVIGCCRETDVASLPEKLQTFTLMRATGVQFTEAGSQFMLEGNGSQVSIQSRFAGSYNIDNMLLVAGVMYARGWSLQRVASALAALQPVPGRLESVESPFGKRHPWILVDYAHTPDALRVMLAALRPAAQARGGRLWCVFGCGGNRDAGKRPLMGAAVAAAADVAVITSDNPRDEQPEAIIDQIVRGMPGDSLKKAVIEVERARAIMRAIWAAQPEDVVLLAGKGHETTQEVAGREIPFSDREWARLALALVAARGVTTDTRRIQAGDLFVALRGERFDGHDFIEQAAAAGALAVVAERPVTSSIPVIVTGDTRRGLLHMGAAWRRRFELPLVAVTGSNGKTTTKEMVASIFLVWQGAEHRLATQGNLNNEIGVPLTLLRLRETHRAAVLELGMNHPGEIALLADAAAPTIALVINAQREHQEFMHTVEAVARENGAALMALPPDGVAVYPGDEMYSPIWDELAGNRKRLRFGFADNLEITANGIELDAAFARFELDTPAGSARVTLSVAGRHNVRNALAATAAALAAGCPLPVIVEGLERFTAVAGRMQWRRLPAGRVLIDDTYNANPDSVRAAIDVLAELPAPRVLVLGDMGEVGEQGPAMHAEVGAYARARGIDHLLSLGQATRHAVDAFGANAALEASPEDLVQRLLALNPVSTLVKGSRFMRMERVVRLLEAQPGFAEEGAGHAS